MPRSWIATLAFFAFTSAFGILTHLTSELAGLGWHDDADLIFSARHAYLACFAIAIFATLLGALARTPEARRRAQISALIDALPFRGRGPAFALASFLAQFAFFALTQIGEGCPLCSGDVFTGVLAAAAAAVVGALLITLGKRRMLALAFAICELLSPSAIERVACRHAERERRLLAQRNRRRTSFSFRYRPPPLVNAPI
jgi:hypothetical protein